MLSVAQACPPWRALLPVRLPPDKREEKWPYATAHARPAYVADQEFLVG